MQTNRTCISISKDETVVLKGIGIIAMLLHHFYSCSPSLDADFIPFFTFLGTIGKVCVAIFLFCSGYGLSVQYRKKTQAITSPKEYIVETLKFLANRFCKFYLNYWFVFILFVPIGIFVFNITLPDRYGHSVNIIKRLFFDIIGIQDANSYNITWWFNRLIILLYLLFPIWNFITKWSWWVAILLSFVMMFLSPYVYESGLFTYTFSFVLGISWDYARNNQYLHKFIQLNPYLLGFVLCLAILTLIILRTGEIFPNFSGIKIDGFIVISFVLLTIVYAPKLTLCTKILACLGKHSMNIYLIHTFLYYYWFPCEFIRCEVVGGADLCAFSYPAY